MASKRHTFTREFKVEAVKLITEKGYSVAEAARSLGLHETLLRSWKQTIQAEGEQAFPGKGNLPAIEEELRRTNAELEIRKARELRDYQTRLALIVDSSQDAIIGKNLDGIVTHWNKGAEEIYGYTAQEMIGRHVSTLAPDERADEIVEILRKIRNGQRVEYFESVRITKEHRRLNMSISVSPIYDADGHVVGASTIARNITAQKKTEAGIPSLIKGSKR